jgi:hypothetical protein
MELSEAYRVTLLIPYVVIFFSLLFVPFCLEFIEEGRVSMTGPFAVYRRRPDPDQKNRSNGP